MNNAEENGIYNLRHSPDIKGFQSICSFLIIFISKEGGIYNYGAGNLICNHANDQKDLHHLPIPE
ncbi:hypothetical protein EG339_04600 [Chryseobacterium bernardetii]|uniref:Uncharacterized protein n=1 Tax=Chryseobacterium bernardetii TaxID=1241978 RepID=A0A3G6TD10_9FLAO|nr:hypothetical protein EG339_04600 [Chryseobacterium bernardetii]